ADGSTYDLVCDGAWKMFTAGEMTAMVRITSSGDPESQVAGRLHRWLKNERSDVLNDLGLSEPTGRRLIELVALLRRTFTIKPGSR
ncbi:MAG: hypothetical protein JXM71_10885, partial [Spirochaetales bacterium]|nr:hypothetical protein [Spirochaetales bacterium]